MDNSSTSMWETLNLGTGENTTKAVVRQKVWEYMEKNDIANFPRPVYHRIPNFKGAQSAGQQVANLPEFQSARTVQVSPDKPQEEVRYLVLEHNKDLIVPTPGLAKGLFNRLSTEPGSTKERIRQLASRQGIDENSKPVPMASRLKVDLFVVGSVAVDVTGRRIGKGEGFADLEFAMGASHHHAVGPDTVVVTTVHDVQVFDQELLPERLFASHDLPVDIIVTPSRIIRVEKRLPKPEGVIWNILTREKFDKIPILKEIQYREKKSGKDVRLKDEAENGLKEYQNGKSEASKKPAQNNRRIRTGKQQTSQDSDGVPGEQNGGSHGNETTPPPRTFNKEVKPDNLRSQQQQKHQRQHQPEEDYERQPQKQYQQQRQQHHGQYDQQSPHRNKQQRQQQQDEQYDQEHSHQPPHHRQHRKYQQDQQYDQEHPQQQRQLRQNRTEQHRQQHQEQFDQQPPHHKQQRLYQQDQQYDHPQQQRKQLQHRQQQQEQLYDQQLPPHKQKRQKQQDQQHDRSKPHEDHEHQTDHEQQQHRSSKLDQQKERSNKRNRADTAPHGSQCNVGLFVGRIPRFARVKDLKDCIAERDVKVNNLIWKGMKGFAFVYLEMEAGSSEEALCSKLQGLKIGDTLLNVELDRKHHPQLKDSDNSQRLQKSRSRDSKSTSLENDGEGLEPVESICELESPKDANNQKEPDSEEPINTGSKLDLNESAVEADQPVCDPSDTLLKPESPTTESMSLSDQPVCNPSDNALKPQSTSAQSLSLSCSSPPVKKRSELTTADSPSHNKSYPVKAEHTLSPVPLELEQTKSAEIPVNIDSVKSSEEKEEHTLSLEICDSKLEIVKNADTSEKVTNIALTNADNTTKTSNDAVKTSTVKIVENIKTAEKVTDTTISKADTTTENCDVVKTIVVDNAKTLVKIEENTNNVEKFSDITLSIGNTTTKNCDVIKTIVDNAETLVKIEHSFKLVLGKPPSTSSDVTLHEALNQLNQTAAFGSSGILLEYHPPELKDLADASNQDFMGLPIWSFASLENPGWIYEPTSRILPALRWSQKRFGLDTVLERVIQENLLLHIDFERTKDILTSFYSYGKKPITENSVTYLKRKYATVQRQFPNTFTEVYLNNLVHLVEGDSKASGNTLLPDLQELEEVYTKEDVDKVEKKLQRMPADVCALLQVRAGIFLQTESVDNLKKLLTHHNNRLRILVTSYVHDQVAIKPLVTALDMVGRKNLILDFPESLTDQLNLVSYIPNNIKELAKSESSIARLSSLFFFSLPALFLTLL